MLASAQQGEQFYFGAKRTLAREGRQHAQVAQLINTNVETPTGIHVLYLTASFVPRPKDALRISVTV